MERSENQGCSRRTPSRNSGRYRAISYSAITPPPDGSPDRFRKTPLEEVEDPWHGVPLLDEVDPARIDRRAEPLLDPVGEREESHRIEEPRTEERRLFPDLDVRPEVEALQE